ncbi:MAG TPA: pitrilysin family protein [Bacteroidia bacterium]|nr:pitrilysin family protein [Bacteroidia bacterium]
MTKLTRMASLILLAWINAAAQQPQGKTNSQLAFDFKVLEEVKKTGDEICIPFRRYQLANGLNILIHEDHSDPICYVDVTYHVGSAREQEGRSGFAHFFEHMMFQGSKHVADEQHFKIITEAGGTLNGTTNTDRTNYFETVPSNQLEKMLWLEADRMGFLLDSVTQKKFEVQRATVKNERGQRYDNAPYGLVGEKIGEALYPQGHPYSWTTIGYIEDLNRVDVNDLKRFYMRWYGPNNAVLTVAGDVNTKEVLALAQKYFGSIQRGPEVKPQLVAPVKLAASRYISYEDNVKFPMLNLAFPSPALNTKDDAALDVLAEILSGNQGSPLYKGFIESKKAVAASAYQYSRELAGQFQIVIRANQVSSLAETEKTLQAILADWEKKGVSDDDIARFRAGYQSSTYNGLSTVQGKGSILASSFTLAKNANNLKEEYKRYMSITKEDVMRVYQNYIKNKAAVILSCLPKGKSDLKAAADNWSMYNRKIEQESPEYKNLSYHEPVDKFNRALIPPAQAAKAVPVPNFYLAKLNNQIPLIGVWENEIPLVNLLFSFKAGHRYESLEKSGVSSLLAAMLQKSTKKTNAEEMENRFSRLGASLRINSGEENLNISLQVPKQNLQQALMLLDEVMFEPKFDMAEFEVEKKMQGDAINQSLSSASSMADMAYKRLLYGTKHVMGNPIVGTLETLSSLSIEDVRMHYESLNASMLSIAVSGDVTQDDLLTKLSFLSKLKSGSELKADVSETPAIDKTRIYFVDKKNAAQSEIRIGYLAMPYDALGEFYKAGIMNFSFAGAFNSRTNYLLREIKGWTYGTRGAFSGSAFTGPYTLSGGFKANATDSTITEFFKELEKYSRDGIKDEELSFTKNAMAQSDALKYESPMQKLGFIKRVLDYNLSKDYVAQQVQILNGITRDEVNALAKKWLPYNNMIIVIVGDRATVYEKLKALPFEVREIDTYGKALN